jgi:DNA processing protein
VQNQTRYHGDMDHIKTPSVLRLAMLMSGLGSRERRLVAEIAGDLDPLPALAEGGVPAAVLAGVRRVARDEAPALLERVVADGWRWLTPPDPDYPALLPALSDPPLGLFVRGDLPNGPATAVVGSRRATAYGRQVAGLVARELAAAGVAVVSGMARGVDAAAHRGALESGGPTVAVWGTGPDRVYPAEHRRLAEEIAAHGALVTEYLPGTPPRRHHFPQRNRILAGMAPVTVVVEAAARSGALVTARLALEEGREVFAVPGSILSHLSVGPNTLLKLGARPLLTPRDLLDELGVPAAATAAAAAGNDGGVLAVLRGGEALAVDDLAERTRAEVPRLLAELLELELAGHVERQPDGRYCLARIDRTAG